MLARFTLASALGGIFLLCQCSDQSSPSTEPKTSIFQILTVADSPSLYISTDVEKLIRNKESEKEQTARLRFKAIDGAWRSVGIEVSARGNTRKKYCDIPPIKLKFSRDFLDQEYLARHKSLKLVIPCKDGEQFEDLIFREYLCYRLFSSLTDQAFQTKMVQVQLIDTQNIRSNQVKCGFLIEHEDEMASRLGGELMEGAKRKIKSIDQASYDLMVLMQYMIGNTDWNLSERHNIKLVHLPNGKAPIPVPYDFDYCGLVNADYASPHPTLPLTNIRERFFQWRGKDKEGLSNAITKVQSQQSQIMNLVASFELLSAESRTDIAQYLSTFFDELNQQDAVAELTRKR